MNKRRAAPRTATSMLTVVYLFLLAGVAFLQGVWLLWLPLPPLFLVSLFLFTTFLYAIENSVLLRDMESKDSDVALCKAQIEAVLEQNAQLTSSHQRLLKQFQIRQRPARDWHTRGLYSRSLDSDHMAAL